MLPLLLAIVSGFLSFVYVVPYIYETVRGTTTPHAVTWSVWTLAAGISALTQIQAGASWSVVVVVGNALGALVVTVLSLRRGIGEYPKIDLLCFPLAIIALILWLAAGLASAAILFAIAADLIATWPTLKKAYLDPESETASAFFIMALAALLGLLANTTWEPIQVLFPAYLLVIFTLLGILASRKKSLTYTIE